MTFPGPAPVSALSKGARAPSLLRRLHIRLQRGAAIVRRIIGVPDYDTYLAHMRQRYPECTPVDPATFERERLTERYRSMGSRCC